jgi:hypothetical protein
MKSILKLRKLNLYQNRKHTSPKTVNLLKARVTRPVKPATEDSGSAG